MALQRLVRQSPDGAGNAERADDLPDKIHHPAPRCSALPIEFAVVKGDAAVLDLGDLALQAPQRW